MVHDFLGLNLASYDSWIGNISVRLRSISSGEYAKINERMAIYEPANDYMCSIHPQIVLNEVHDATVRHFPELDGVNSLSFTETPYYVLGRASLLYTRDDIKEILDFATQYYVNKIPSAPLTSITQWRQHIEERVAQLIPSERPKSTE